MPQKTLRIFISSPGDVAEERDKARVVIESLQRHYPEVVLKPILWEELPLPATATFQQTIEYVLEQEPIDIAIFILWSRLGTPLGPPLTRGDGSPYRSGTEREFDLMLQAFEQSGRQRPIILAYSRDDKGDVEFHKALSRHPSHQWEGLIEQRKLAESFVREQFTDAQGRNVRAYHLYREPVNFAQRLHTHLRNALDELLVQTSPRWLAAPYRGLEVFDVEHAPIFQGRDEETCDVLQRLRDQEHSGCAFTVIVGASGSGKSSLARAGVAAALTQHAYDDHVKEWRVVTLFPSFGGGDLNRSLVRTLAEQMPELRSSANSLEDIASGMAKDAALTLKLSIVPAFARASEAAHGAVRILMLVDQLEELWTDRRITDIDREQFLGLLEALARSGPIAVLATLRSDFYPHAQKIPTFLQMKGDRGHYDLLPPVPAALHRLITEPARLAGLRFEQQVQTGRTLDQLILQDASRDPAALPLLQYALSELYQQCDEEKRLLTFAAYERLGGVEGALGKRAADTFHSMPPEVQAALPEILPQLVTIDIDGEQSAVRRRAPLSSLTDTPNRKTLTEALIAARFLTTDRQDDTPIVSLAHEALLRRWEELSQWVASNREHLRLRVRAEQSQQRWSQQNEDPSLFLPSGLPLEEGQILLRNARPLLTAESVRYIERSVDHRDSESRRQRRVRNTALAMSLTAALISMIAAIWINSERTSAVTAKNQETAAKNNEKQQRQLAQKSEREANDAKEAEVKQRKRAEAQQVEIEKQLRTMESSQYDSILSQAREAIEQGATERARYHLRQCTRWDMCSWEYDYLNGLIDGQLGVRRRSYVLEDFMDDEDTAISLSPTDDLAAIRMVKVDVSGTSGTRKIPLIRLVKLQDLTPIRDIDGDSRFTCATFSSDGLRVIGGTENGSLTAYSVATGDVILRWTAASHFKNKISAVIACNDGKYVVTASGPLITVWDATTAQLVRRLTLPLGSQCTKLVASRNGSWIASAFENRTVRVWNIKEGKELHSFTPVYGYPTSVALSPDGSRLAVGTSAGGIYLWNISSHELVGLRSSGDNPVTAIEFSDNGVYLATGHENASVQIWDPELKSHPSALLGHSGRVRDVHFSVDNDHLITLDSTMVINTPALRVWSLDSSGAQDTPIFTPFPTSSCFTIDSTFLTSHANGVITTYNPLTKQVSKTTTVPLSQECSIKSSQNGYTHAVLNDRSVDIIRTNQDSKVLSLPCSSRPTDVRFDADATVAVVQLEDQSVAAWEILGNAPLSIWTHSDTRGAVVLDSSTIILASSKDTCFTVHELRSGQQIASVTTLEPLNTTMAASPDGRVFVAVEGHSTIAAWAKEESNPAKWVRLGSVYCSYAPMSMSVSPDSKRLFVAGYDPVDFTSGRGVVGYWSMSSSSPLQVFRRYPYAAFDVQFSPSGRFMSVIHGGLGGGGNSMKRIDIYNDGALFQERHVYSSIHVMDVAIARDDSVVLCVGGQGNYGRAEAKNFELVDFATGGTDHDGLVQSPDAGDLCAADTPFNSVDASPDGRSLVTADEAGKRLIFWDIKTNRATIAITGLPAGPMRVRFSPDGTRVAAILVGRSVHIWNVSTRKLETIFQVEPDKSSRLMTWSPDGTMIAVSASREILLYDCTLGSRIDKIFSHPAEVTALAFSGAGHTLFTGCHDSIIRAWDYRSGSISSEMSGHEGEIKDLAVHPSNSYVSSLDSDGGVLVWDIAKASVAETIVRPTESRRTNSLVRLLWARDGQRLFGAGTVGHTQWRLYLPNASTPVPFEAPKP